MNAPRHSLYLMAGLLLSGCAGGGRPSPNSARVISGPCEARFDPTIWKAEAPEAEPGLIQFMGPAAGDVALLKCQEASSDPAALKAAIIENLKTKDPDAKILADEIRRVNGRDVMFLKAETVSSDTRRLWWTYLYAAKGTVGRFMVSHAGDDDDELFEPVGMALLNGLTIKR